MLDQKKHRFHLINILLKLYKDTEIASVLGFKGGTAAYLFYDLPRFSVDLDFDLLGSFNKMDKITALLAKDYVIKDQFDKRYTLFWLISYGKGSVNIKIEVSKRPTKNRFESKFFYGVSVAAMVLPDMIANKLTAIVDRKKFANRDIFDAHYFLSQPGVVEINYQLIKERTGLEAKQFYQKMYQRINKKRQENLLHGMGELLTGKQKTWVKEKLLDELNELIKIQLDILKKEGN